MESALVEGVDALNAEELEDATSVFREAFRSPCRDEEPRDIDVGNGHFAKCHLVGNKDHDTVLVEAEDG